MNVISVEVTYPSLLQSPLSTPPCISTPIFRSQSTFGSDQTRDQKGIVGCYDIDELNEELRLFGISDETRRTLLRKRKPATRNTTRDISTNVTSLTRDVHYNNRNPSSKSREQSRKMLLRHSAASRSCYVDFSANFRDAVRARSVKMASKNPVPAWPVCPNSGQRTIPRTPKAQKCSQSKQMKKEGLVSESNQVKNGLLVIANGKVLDFQKDVKRSAKLHERERKRLRKEMREHLDIVRSFDDIFETFDATKMQIEQMKSK